MNKKQKIILILGLGLLLFLPLTKFVKAQETTTGGIDIMTGHYILGWLGSLLVKAASFLVNLAIGLNFRILGTPFITDGWKIARDLANLGFVLFIIVIAIATILRMQQYGAKNTLGKLIAVALLVNFSLVFAGIFIDFSNMLTNFFIKNVTTVGPGELAGALANAFNPATILDTTLEGKGSGNWVEKIKGLIDVIIDPAKGLSALLTWIGGIFFVIAFTLVLAFTLFTLAIMFLIRFVSLSILLVLLPLACLFFILPATKKLWDQWWNNFMKWIIFAPVASFFLYLGVKMLIDTSSRSDINELAELAQGQGTINSLNFGDTLPNADLFSQMAKGVVFVGFVLGGLIAANSMGIHGSKAFLGMAQATGKWARGAIGRTALRAGTWPARTDWGQKAAGALSRAGTKLPTGLRWIGAPVRGIGTAISRAGMAGERLVEEAAKRQKGISADRLATMAPSLGGFELVAALERVAKEKKLGKVHNFTQRYLNENTQNLFKRYGKENVFKDIEKSLGINTEMYKAKTDEDRLKAAIEFRKTFSREDEGKTRLNDLYGDKPAFGLTMERQTELRDVYSKAIREVDIGRLANIVPKMNSKQTENFFDSFLKETTQKVADDIKASVEETTKRLGRAGILKHARSKEFISEDEYKAVDRTLARRLTGFFEQPPAPPPPAA